ncbi:unnamed protein product, partial [Mycena citricolor]
RVTPISIVILVIAHPFVALIHLRIGLSPSFHRHTQSRVPSQLLGLLFFNLDALLELELLPQHRHRPDRPLDALVMHPPNLIAFPKNVLVFWLRGKHPKGCRGWKSSPKHPDTSVVCWFRRSGITSLSSCVSGMPTHGCRAMDSKGLARLTWDI